MSRVRRLLGAFIVLATFVAATAMAAGGITIVHKTSAAPGGASQRSVKCSKSDHAIAGGFAVPEGQNFAQQSNPSGDRGWHVEALTSPGDMTAYALCEHASARKLKRVSKTLKFPAGDSPDLTIERSVKAKCPKGWKVISGGWKVDPPYAPMTMKAPQQKGEIAVDASKRVKSRIWKVHGGNDGRPTDLIAYAICEKANFSAVQQVAEKVDTPSTDSYSAIAECPPSTHVVGGGFQVKPDESGADLPFVSANRPASATQWKATQITNYLDSSLTSFAECEAD
jgi:hypothetical protein